MLKRTFDIIFSLIGLGISLPILLVITLAIKYEDGGPVLFRQVRIGKHGKKFIIWKFRSMSVVESTNGYGFDPGNKSRITKTGTVIRKTKLDELPQLINVLKGDMSFVGPRPEVEYWVNRFPERWSYIHQVRPGMTDNASIEFRNEEDILANSPNPEIAYEKIIMPRKLTLYENYVKNKSLPGDIRIMIKTIIALFNRNN